MIDEKLIEKARQTLRSFDKDQALEIVKEYVSAGENPLELMDKAFIPGITEIGEMFSSGTMFLPELIQAAGVMKAVTGAISEAQPKKFSQGEEEKQKVVIIIGTVEGDIHDIGKILVVTMLDVHGYTVHDLGHDVSTETFIKKAVELNADIIGTSALLTTTMSKQKELEEALKKAGLRERFKTIVGGAPVTRRWADKIGADAYAEDAHEAVVKVKALLNQ